MIFPSRAASFPWPSTKLGGRGGKIRVSDNKIEFPRLQFLRAANLLYAPLRPPLRAVLVSGITKPIRGSDNEVNAVVRKRERVDDEGAVWRKIDGDSRDNSGRSLIRKSTDSSIPSSNNII